MTYEQIRQTFTSPDSEIGRWVLALVGLLVFAILFYVFRFVFRRKSDEQTSFESVSFDDIERMKKRGLLTDEEERRVRAALSRRWVEEYGLERASLEDLPAIAARAESGKDRDAATRETPSQGAKAGERSAGEGDSRKPDPSGKAETEDERVSAGASLVELARMGEISKEEFEALRKVFEEREKRG